MEKFRKFADEKNGINPFINAPKVKPRPLWLKIFRPAMYLLAITKLFLVVLLFSMIIVIRGLCSLLFCCKIGFFIQSITSTILSSILLLLCGVFPPSKTSVNKKTIILSSQSNLIDWLILIYQYSPTFITISKHRSRQQPDQLIEIPYINLFFHMIGFTTFNYELNNQNAYPKFDLTKWASGGGVQPIVFFPEGCKTTREATVTIRSPIMDQIYKAYTDKKIDLVSHITIFKWEYFCPNNTTDRRGLRNLFNLLSQLYNPSAYQIIKLNRANFDLGSVDASIVNSYKSHDYYFDSLVQETLVHPIYSNNKCQLNSLDAEEYIAFYEATLTTNYIK